MTTVARRERWQVTCSRILPEEQGLNSRQEMGQELNEEIICSTSLKYQKVPRTDNRVQRWFGKRNVTRVLRNNRTNLLESQIERLVPAFLGRDLHYVYMFLGTYQAFANTQEVLDLLFARAIYSILSIWLEQYPEDFLQPPEFLSLNTLLSYARLNMPASELERHAQLLLTQLQHPGAMEPGAGAPGSEQNPEPPQELAPAPTEAQDASFQPELAQPIPGAGADQSARAVMPPALLGPGQVVVTALIHAPELEEPPAPFPDLEVDQDPAPAP